MNIGATYQADSTGFEKALYERASEHFRNTKQARHGSWSVIFKGVIMLALFFIPYGLILSNTLSLLEMLVLVIVMGAALVGIAVNIVHDACHNAFFQNKSANNILGALLVFVGGYPENWRVQHNYLHHYFTNIFGLDEDIDTRGILVMSPFGLSQKLRKYQHLYALPLYSLALLYWVFIKDFKQYVKYKRHGLYKQNANHLAWILISKAVVLGYLLVIPMLVLDIKWWQVLLGFCILEFTAGLLSTMIFQLAHVNDGPKFIQPSAESTMSTSWAVHQLLTTANFATRNRLLFWLCGGLNHQIEHHLFPGVCHTHYRDLAKIVQKTAAEYNVPYNEISSTGRAIKCHLETLKSIGSGKSI